METNLYVESNVDGVKALLVIAILANCIVFALVSLRRGRGRLSLIVNVTLAVSVIGGERVNSSTFPPEMRGTANFVLLLLNLVPLLFVPKNLLENARASRL